MRITPDVTDSVTVYGILQCNGLTTQWSDSVAVLQRSGLKFTVHHLDDGTQIDSLYVSHH